MAELLAGIGAVELITWVGTAGVIIGSIRVTLNGTREAIHNTNKTVTTIADTQVRQGEHIAVLDERTRSHGERIDRIGARLDQ